MPRKKKRPKNWDGWGQNPISQERGLTYKREWGKKTYKERRREYIDKRGGVCERCSCSVSLEFHHRMPLFKTTHRIFRLSRKRIEAELAHCELLCRKPCHVKAQAELKKPKQFCGI